jgi:hypothetical protein
VTKLGDKTYQAEQKRLRDWLALEEIRLVLSQATKHKDREKVAESLCLYVSVAFGLDKSEIESLPWKQVAFAFAEGAKANSVELGHIAFLRGQTQDDAKEAWEYPGRTWWTWAQTFAKEFGWSLEYISNLNVLDAVSLFQEFLLSQQFKREWEWNLSEYSTKYNTTTKKSDPNPLPRPDWMKMYSPKSLETPKLVKIPKGMMPVGNIIRHTDTNN